MQITSTRQIRAVTKKDAEDGVTVSAAAARDAQDGDLTEAARAIDPKGQFQIEIRSQDFDVMTVQQIDAFFTGVATLSSEPGLSYHRTTTGAVLGGLTGFGLGVMFQQAGVFGQQSGNPLIGSIAIAVAAVGAGLGGLAGSGIAAIEIKKDKDGVFGSVRSL